MDFANSQVNKYIPFQNDNGWTYKTFHVVYDFCCEKIPLDQAQ